MHRDDHVGSERHDLPDDLYSGAASAGPNFGRLAGVRKLFHYRDRSL